jgi:hypothetical protein
MTTTNLDLAEIEAALGRPIEDFAFDCHGAALTIVRSGVVDGRVARGWCHGIASQHSWVVIGDDCYDAEAPIIDAVFWCYQADMEPGIWTGTMFDDLHHPHGEGSIWAYGKPPEPVGEVIPLAVELEGDARRFMDIAAPYGLDHHGWIVLAGSPVGGWPAREITEAMLDTEALAPLVRIDIAGMLTDRNPDGLYLREPSDG